MKKTNANKVIEHSIETLPQFIVPASLKESLRKLMLIPAFSLWQLLLTLLILMSSPAILAWLGHRFYSPYTRATGIVLYATLGMFVLALITVITIHLIYQNREAGKSYGARLDSWLDQLFPR